MDRQNTITHQLDGAPVPEAGRKILVAVDGSIYSSNALHYLVTLFAGMTDLHLHLFSIVAGAGLPAAGREWMDESSLLSAMSSEGRNRYSRTKRYLTESAAMLVRKGLRPEQVSTQLQLSRQGIAADILQLARHGLYDALVIGRRGISKLEEFFMGSVSASVLATCWDVPIWVVDKHIESRKILVPVDGSFDSLRAVEHLAFVMADNPGVEITLFHSSAMFSTSYRVEPEQYYQHWGKEWCDRYLGGEDSLYQAPRQLLLQAGVAGDRIFWLHAFKGIEPSRQIIRQALIDDFGTIVLGRRRGDAKKGLFKGVSDRVVFMADQVAIWIV